MGILELSTILLTLASVFTLINIRLLKLPQTIGLMILALCLSVILTVVGIIFPQVFEAVTEITREFDFSELLVNVMLPFLLFAGAISVNVHELLKDKVTILFLASFGVAINFNIRKKSNKLYQFPLIMTIATFGLEGADFLSEIFMLQVLLKHSE